MIRIAFAEDNPFIEKSLIEKLSFFDDLKLKYSASNGAEIVGKVTSDSNIDLILMDIQMPEMNGIEATRLIKNKHPQIKIVMLTVFDDDENIFNSIQAGADGYLLKDTDPKTLFDSIQEVMAGGATMTPSIALKALNLLRNPIKISTPQEESIALTKRETEILVQISKGLNYIEIAENLNISPATVRKHIENIYKKLQVHNKVEAVQKGIKNNLI
jgi:DNA-binding NarL/FixJ family response regulator